MQIEIKIDETCREPKVVILTDRITDEVNNLFNSLNGSQPQAVAGFQQDRIEILDPEQIIRCYAAGQRVYAQTRQGEYTIRLRLYELEERLDKRSFVRISNSEIINIKRVISMDLSFSGTICVNLEGDTVSFASRRYVTKIKKLLGI